MIRNTKIFSWSFLSACCGCYVAVSYRILGCKYQQISCIWGEVGSTMPHQRKPKVLIETFGFCLSSIIDNGIVFGDSLDSLVIVS